MFEIDQHSCRARQQRLLDEMQEQEIDIVLLASTENVQWLTGHRTAWFFEAAASLAADGTCTLVAADKDPIAAADQVVGYDAKWLSTLRNDQRDACSAALVRSVPPIRRAKRVGTEFAWCGLELVRTFGGTLIDIEPDLFRLRRRKHADELARIRKALLGTGQMYKRAREIVEPGINELEVFSQLQSAAVREFGEALTGTGNDYQCGSRGGPARDRAAQDGELYILDLGPAFKGYFADTCRTLAVNGRPTDLQQAAWEQIAAIFPYIMSTVRPGVRCCDVFHEVKSRLDAYMPGSFNHHLGHGFGLFPHEAPHLNPNWDDIFEEGEVFTVEPGLYSPDLRAGIRLENDYLVTADGVELLSDFPLAL